MAVDGCTRSGGCRGVEPNGETVIPVRKVHVNPELLKKSALTVRRTKLLRAVQLSRKFRLPRQKGLVNLFREANRASQMEYLRENEAHYEKAVVKDGDGNPIRDGDGREMHCWKDSDRGTIICPAVVSPAAGPSGLSGKIARGK